MSTPILCLVALLLVVWILLLRSENNALKKQNQTLQREMRERLNRATGGVEVTQGRRLTASEVGRIDRTIGSVGKSAR